MARLSRQIQITGDIAVAKRWIPLFPLWDVTLNNSNIGRGFLIFTGQTGFTIYPYTRDQYDKHRGCKPTLSTISRENHGGQGREQHCEQP
ncbi:hypothetical protein GCM10011498_37000 [Amylibacter cionae]|uniref:Uncharacterized protein n=1 Tax=Neptunicoccus cionae TaxID=2035344 RepID=A0A916R3W8_9RHOB|nr:hypothetical protein GCM10011498_37000 [Amylibacter cionae]